MATSERITADEANGLWHAVQWMALCLKQPIGDAEHAGLADQLRKLAAAKRGLRKVQAARRAALAKTKPQIHSMPENNSGS